MLRIFQRAIINLKGWLCYKWVTGVGFKMKRGLDVSRKSKTPSCTLKRYVNICTSSLHTMRGVCVFFLWVRQTLSELQFWQLKLRSGAQFHDTRVAATSVEPKLAEGNRAEPSQLLPLTWRQVHPFVLLLSEVLLFVPLRSTFTSNTPIPIIRHHLFAKVLDYWKSTVHGITFLVTSYPSIIPHTGSSALAMDYGTHLDEARHTSCILFYFILFYSNPV